MITDFITAEFRRSPVVDRVVLQLARIVQGMAEAIEESRNANSQAQASACEKRNTTLRWQFSRS
jgi:hypothetical protein